VKVHFVLIFFKLLFQLFLSLFLIPEDKKLPLFKFSVSVETLEMKMPKILRKRKYTLEQKCELKAVL
jgi:hypothetical protein